MRGGDDITSRRPTSGTRQSIDITAVYTGLTWWWAGFDGADLLHVPAVRPVFWLTNAALSILRLLRPLPSLPHSLVQRHALVDALLAESGLTRVLEGAAGFSPRGLSFSRDERIDYVEIDLPAIARVKLELLRRGPAGREASSRPNWRILPGDLLTFDLSAIHLGPEPVFLITEGLLMYLAADQQRDLWQRLAVYLADKPGSIYVFDLVPSVEKADGGPLGRWLGRVLRWFRHGRGFVEDRRDRRQILQELLDCGFETVQPIEPRDAEPTWCIPHLDEHTQALLFLCRVRA